MTAAAVGAVTPRGRWTALEGFEAAFYVIVLMMMSEALLGPLFGGVDDLPAPAWLQLMWLPVYGIMAGLLVLRLKIMPRVWIAGVLTAGIVGIAFASTLWSIMPDVTIRRAVALLFTSLLGMMIAARYDWRGMIELFATTFLILAVGSIIAAVAVPSFGIHLGELHQGAWRGLWQEKNQLGAGMAKGVLACLSAAVVSPRRRWFWAGGAAVCSALVLLSTSTTALLAWLTVLAGGVALFGLRRGGGVTLLTVWGLTIGLILSLGTVLLAPEIILAAVGKDATLTGRTDIWVSILRRVEERPWEGYGYGAFWIDPQGPAWWVRSDIGWRSPTAHNGWLDVLVQTGWIGLGVFAVHFAVTAGAASLRLFRGDEALWVLLSIALFTLFSISESTIMQQNNYNWVMYVATTAKLLELRRRAAPRLQPYLVQAGRALVAPPPAASLRRISAAP